MLIEVTYLRVQRGVFHEHFLHTAVSHDNFAVLHVIAL